MVLAIDRWHRQHGQQRAKPKVISQAQRKPTADPQDNPLQDAA
jgi:hypothetical protein